MIGARAYGVVSTIFGAVTVGAGVSPAQTAQNLQDAALTFVPYVGQVPVFAVGVGALTALLVRVITVTSNPGKLWSYNAAVTLLAMLGAVMFIIDHKTGPGMSFWIGGGFGAAGVGIVGVAKSKFGEIAKGVVEVLRTAVNPPPGPDKP